MRVYECIRMRMLSALGVTATAHPARAALPPPPDPTPTELLHTPATRAPHSAPPSAVPPTDARPKRPPRTAGRDLLTPRVSPGSGGSPRPISPAGILLPRWALPVGAPGGPSLGFTSLAVWTR
ncbi:vegetative cell wall protein gp1-like, partial [Penaeus japonicus]|uniref:vegetative cell wall protein gp1-like n=1 Tax=Penaeus japonicus TaxID=27405 RepID=UPI001C70E800